MISVDIIKNKFPTCNTLSDFTNLVKCLRQIGEKQVLEDLVLANLSTLSGKLRVDKDSSFNVFTRIYSGDIQNPGCFENYMLGYEDDMWFVAHNRPDNIKNWNNLSPEWVGKSCMSKTHVFICPKSYDWKLANVALLCAFADKGTISKTLTTLNRAAENYAMCKGIENLGIFFHCWGFNSVPSWHTHIIDMSELGPSYYAQTYKNITLSDIFVWVKAN